MTDVKNVSVLGAGNLGAQIAYRLAFYGFNTTSYDINDDAIEAAKGRLETIAGKYVRDLDDVSEDKAKATAAAVKLTTSLEEAAKDADIIIEAVPENLEIKRETYSKLAEFLPAHTIVLTNTSTLLPSSFKDSTGRPEKFLAYHFANDIHIANIVEVMPTDDTDPAVVDQIVEFAPEMGMQPIRLNREQPKYIINSLYSTWVDQARDLWVRGVADIETIDKVAAMIAGSSQLSPFLAQDRTGFGVVYGITKNRAETGDPLAAEFNRRLKEDFMDKGHIGKESGEGFYVYDENGNPTGLSEAAKKNYPPVG
ncbi:3-hydroxyacyl-CoA dehydrogenase [Corynebacterium liangguodongii]|uniref:3-hydroxyacyl-CoA dehydrogenase n=1 Tax=Corynebacterium liangguodongii TaxID=2079535 RepID=A0A2S0WG37_9CORY|nr:3-hydroxyacyl-CoA dehydrogenase [Corynebacterium liangguodongii]AWB84748.1 3-hydroxyacyl-CoA dehydrogenase [Corynebacterium liangguodongii]PWB99756.1 3-hydroxyacyl-CoA dehydrogenase [Corynebacterium liangguodongii]